MFSQTNDVTGQDQVYKMPKSVCRMLKRVDSIRLQRISRVRLQKLRWEKTIMVARWHYAVKVVLRLRTQ